MLALSTYLLPAILGIGAIGLLLHDLLKIMFRRPPQGLRRVPGPKGHTIFGNSAQLSARPQREFQHWARTYGELFQIRLGLTKWIYVNSVEATRELFDKQSALTASRPPTPVASDLIGGDMRFVLMADNAKWKYLRSCTHKLLTPSKSMTYMPNQEIEAKQLAYDILFNNNDQAQFYTHVRRFATSVIMMTTYGWRLPDSVLVPPPTSMESNNHIDGYRMVKISNKSMTYFMNCLIVWSPEPMSPMRRLFSHACPIVYNGGGKKL